MPELPEVEHNRKNLAKWMDHARITRAASSDERIVGGSPRSFARLVGGRRVERVDRRGKWLRLTLEDDMLLFAHLGMTGWFHRAAPDDPPLRFERARLDLARASVRYTDPRRWGRLVATRASLPAWDALGPDPLADGIDPKALAARLARRKASVKEALMDQSVLAGVGNIQAIEALWKARIDPRSRASALGPAHVGAVVRGLRWTIARTLADLEQGEAAGDDGDSDPFIVYGKKGEPCRRCGARLERTLLGGRTTTFCPSCQVRLR